MKSVALGNFDGVHIAHRAVLEQAAKSEESLCLLFDKHPLAFLRSQEPESLLLPEQTRQKILACGIDRCVYMRFEKVAHNTPRRFFEDILLKRFRLGRICCGFNYTFGKDRAGDVHTLASLCKEHGVELQVLDPVLFEGEAVSSSRIRACIRSGAIEKANRMLSYRFFYESPVEEGKRLGRELGFPTLNQAYPEQLVKPRAGVYASLVHIDGKVWRGLTNLGDNPTIGGERFRSETHLFDYSGKAYGKTVRVELVEFIRDEKKFDTVQALRAQVIGDIERAKACTKQ